MKFDFTPEQQRVITWPHSPGRVTVQAVAGSGKTSVLIERVKRLVEQGVPARRILFVTFSKDATNTLNERLQAVRGLSGCRASTLHSFVSSLLNKKTHAYSFMLQDQLASVIFKANPHGFPDEDKFKTALSLAKQELRLGDVEYPDFHLQECQGPDMATPDLWAALREYEALRTEASQKQGQVLLGHDDLLLWGLHVLRATGGPARQHCDSYEVVIADEYQDVSPLQAELIERIADGKHFMAVGDPEQSIFAFQGGTPHSFLRLTSDTAPLRLTDNFRCPGTHLLAASMMIGTHQPLVAAKGFWGELRVDWYNDPDLAYRTLSSRVHDLLERNGQPVTVLVRSTTEAENVTATLDEAGLQVSSKHRPQNELFRDEACGRLLRPVLTCLKRRRTRLHPLQPAFGTLRMALSPSEYRRLNEAWFTGRTPQQTQPDQSALSPELEDALGFWEAIDAFEGTTARHLLALLRPFLRRLTKEQQNLLVKVLGRDLTLITLDQLLKTEEVQDARVTVSTIHAAKGREFPCVVIFDGSTPPPKYRREEQDDQTDFELYYDTFWTGTEDVQESSEEDRICYVALTRSTEILHALLPHHSHYRRAFAMDFEFPDIHRLLSRPHLEWKPGDDSLLKKMTRNVSLNAYLDRYWWQQADPDSLKHAAGILHESNRPVPATWSALISGEAKLHRRPFRVRRIPFCPPEPKAEE